MKNVTRIMHDKHEIAYLVNVSDCPTLKPSKKDGNVFYHVYKRSFIFLA